MTSNKPTLAVAMIVKNEAKHLQACLETVYQWVDEIVILDSGSIDETEIIARKYTDKFYTNLEWPGFGKQRQLAQSYVESDFVLWLDADERVTSELKHSIEQQLNSATPPKVFNVTRLNKFFGKDIRHCGWYPEYVTRMYQVKHTSYNDSLVHEKVIVNKNEKTTLLNGDIIHFPYNDISHYLKKSSKYGQIWSKDKYIKGKIVSLSNCIIHSLSAFIKMYIIKRGFLDGQQGLILCLLSSYSVFVKYLYLLELHKDKTSE